MTVPDYEMPKDMVPSGAQTGIYYIPISSLPFNVSWQQIKDYVRQVCDVDHVEVFQKSTSGWVRVKGRENFDAAFGHLNGKVFNGRAIIADDRNRDSPILVRDLMVCKPTGSSGRPSRGGGSTGVSATPDSPLRGTGGPVSYPDSSMLSSPTSTASSSFSQGGDGWNTSLSLSSFTTSPDTSFSHSAMPGYDNLLTGFSQPAPMSTYGFGLGPSPIQAPQSFMTYATLPAGSQAIYSPTISYAVQPPYNEYYPPVTTALTNQLTNMAIGGSSGGGVIYTEQRGIQIRDISRRVSGDQIRKMIREATGPEAGLINAIEIPSDKDGKPRGLAFVHFGTADLARRMERQLNGIEFKGRKLQVRLMKDGETIFGGGGGSTTLTESPSKLQRSNKHSSHHHHQQSNKDDRRRAERKEKASGSGSSSASKYSPPSSSSKNAPLVVGAGLTAKASMSSSSSTKDKGKDKHSGKKSSSVVIVDGSSGRRPSDADKR